ncbi:unnamed protein product [Orchesella dallaii]|uniref:SDE2-like domain-containing protein n=1 Tax=Orchesella dallaii TaxID=48710 RepID=A0ABP1PZH8_9HEXA
MRIVESKSGDLKVLLPYSPSYNDVATLKRVIKSTLKMPSDFEDEDSFYLLWNGKILTDEQMGSLPLSSLITIVPRVLGGKGGFGSMLRAIGAQIEKTTNRDACRDLSGRRLRDINEEQRLKKWFSKQEEREHEKAEARKRKLHKLRQFVEGPPLPKIDDQQYLQQREDMVDAVFAAVDKGFEVSKDSGRAELCEIGSNSSGSSSEDSTSQSALPLSSIETPVAGGSGSRGVTEIAGWSKANVIKEKKKTTIKKTMLDEGLDSCSSSDDDDEDEVPTKIARLQ